MASAPGDFKVHRTALIDGDIIVWKASAFAHDHQEDELDVAERVTWDVQDWMKRAFCSEAIVCFSGPRELNFRRDAWPLYKTARPDERPNFHRLAVDVIQAEFRTFQRDNLEADDCLGLLATLRTVESPVIVSIDKDMRTISGWHFNPDKQDFPTLITWEQAERNFLIQWAMGDRVDGYKGIERVGEKGAERILLNASVGTGVIGCGVNAVLKAYKDKGHTFEYALSQARCARILTADWWDREAKKPVLWAPGACDVEGLEEWMRESEEIAHV